MGMGPVVISGSMSAVTGTRTLCGDSDLCFMGARVALGVLTLVEALYDVDIGGTDTGAAQTWGAVAAGSTETWSYSDQSPFPVGILGIIGSIG